MAVRKTAKGAALKRWFKEDWKDVRDRQSLWSKKRRRLEQLPIVDLAKRVSSKTPKDIRRNDYRRETLANSAKEKLGATCREAA
jgi:hypothetical protein